MCGVAGVQSSRYSRYCRQKQKLPTNSISLVMLENRRVTGTMSVFTSCRKRSKRSYYHFRKKNPISYSTVQQVSLVKLPFLFFILISFSQGGGHTLRRGAQQLRALGGGGGGWRKWLFCSLPPPCCGAVVSRYKKKLN